HRIAVAASARRGHGDAIAGPRTERYLAGQADHALTAPQRVFAGRAGTAAARAAATRISGDAHGQRVLDHFDRRVARVGHVRLHRAGAGAARTAAGAAADGFVVGELIIAE